MTTPLKAIVSDDGLTARPVNPYPYNYDHDIYPSVEYSDFEDNNKSLPLSTPQQPGTEILVREVWQCKGNSGAEWFLIDDWDRDFHSEFGRDFRKAYEPIALPEQDKGETKTTDLIEFILEIDFMTTKEFCTKFNYEPPSWRGNTELAAMEFAYIDAMKWSKVKEFAKKLKNN